MTLSRPQALPFSPRQVELLATFADQAVIAVENARLFDEVQARTRDLTESLEQQTATAEVLKVISRSAFDLQPVLDTLIESGVRLCNATRGTLRLRDGDLFPLHAFAGDHSAESLDFLRLNPIKAEQGTVAGRAALTGLPQNVADVRTDPEYGRRDFPRHTRNRSFLAVPLLRDGQVKGLLCLARQELQPFTPRQVELLATFADQAVIALENARLFDAVQKRTRELAQSVSELQALEEVLRAVNSSLDLETVLATIISRAVQLSQADEGTITNSTPRKRCSCPRLPTV
jgi:GAF domain-containing protein